MDSVKFSFYGYFLLYGICLVWYFRRPTWGKTFAILLVSLFSLIPLVFYLTLFTRFPTMVINKALQGDHIRFEKIDGILSENLQISKLEAINERGHGFKIGTLDLAYQLAPQGDREIRINKLILRDAFFMAKEDLKINFQKKESEPLPPLKIIIDRLEMDNVGLHAINTNKKYVLELVRMINFRLDGEAETLQGDDLEIKSQFFDLKVKNLELQPGQIKFKDDLTLTLHSWELFPIKRDLTFTFSLHHQKNLLTGSGLDKKFMFHGNSRSWSILLENLHFPDYWDGIPLERTSLNIQKKGVNEPLTVKGKFSLKNYVFDLEPRYQIDKAKEAIVFKAQGKGEGDPTLPPVFLTLWLQGPPLCLEFETSDPQILETLLPGWPKCEVKRNH